MQPKTIDLLRCVVSLGAALVAVVVARYYIAPGVDLEGMSRGIAGPGTWPKVVLYGAAVCAALLFGRTVTALWRSGGGAALGKPRDAEDGGGTEEHDDVRLAIGIALIVAYGLAIGLIGMAWATMAFVAAWLVLGGLRRPLTVVLVSTLGTAAILYLFVKISLMPLDRGQGIFEQATIALYRILGIY